MNGYNFTERVRKVLAMARQEAHALHHEYVGTEHILLGIVQEGEGVGASALLALAVSRDDIVARVHGVVKRGKSADSPRADLPYTSRAKKVLELAMLQARESSHSYVGTEHLLLGLVAEEKGIAAQILMDSGVTFDKLRTEILRILGTELPPQRVEGRAAGSSVRWPGSLRLGSMVDRVLGTNRGTAPAEEPAPEGLSKVMIAALALAKERECGTVDPTHLMLVLLAASRGTGVSALRLLGANMEELIAAVDLIAPRGVTLPDTLALDVPHVNAMAMGAQRLWHRAAMPPETGDIILALLDVHPPMAAVFAERGFTPEKIAVSLDAMRD